MPTAYDPYNPTQARFLSALAMGESPGGAAGLYVGTGGADLTNAPVDEHGFPQWAGYGNSHAAGWFQFQPGTWAPYAEKYNLNFKNPNDQKAGAWYLAQDTYKAQTGEELNAALARGDYGSIQGALRDVWPSVTGNGANPYGLSTALEKGQGVDVDTRGNLSQDTSGGGIGGFFSDPMGSLIGGAMGGSFVRLALIIVGGILLVVALWQLLSQVSEVPSPGDAVQSAVKVGTTAAAVFI